MAHLKEKGIVAQRKRRPEECSRRRQETVRSCHGEDGFAGGPFSDLQTHTRRPGLVLLSDDVARIECFGIQQQLPMCR